MAVRNVDHVDYSALAQAGNDYGDAAIRVDELLKKLISTNSLLASAWQNDTSDAFLERFEREYKPAMQNLEESVGSLSNYLKKYIEDHQSEDRQKAAAVRG